MRRGLRAVLVRARWRDSYDLMIAQEAGGTIHAGTSVGDDGFIVYTEFAEAALVPTLLRLSGEEVDAILASMDGRKPEDATHDAMLDARATRDRLLAMFEAKGVR